MNQSSKLLILFSIILFFSKCMSQTDTRKIDLTRHHPTRVLQLLIETCVKNEDSCHMSVDSTAQFLSNINELVINYEDHYDPNFLEAVETLSRQLAHCKDVNCLLEFEKEHGKYFITTVQKASNILSSLPEVEKMALEHLVLQPPEYLH